MEVVSKRRLLVPMNIEALLVGQIPDGDGWVDLKPDFRGIYYNQFLGQQLEKEPFGPLIADLHGPGVHLHWALPDGLTHGSKAGNQDLKFPVVPNRWLIVRFWDEGAEKKLQLRCRAWIVESDTVTNDEQAPSWPRLRSEQPQKASDYSVFVGKRSDFDDWQEPASAERVEITAVGYGDPAFAAFYPSCKGILGFHDFDLDGLQNVTLNYFVAGWYSFAADDPLHQAIATEQDVIKALDAFLTEKRWIYPGLAETLDKAQQAESLENELKEQKEMAQRLKASLQLHLQQPGATADAKDSGAHPGMAHLARTRNYLQTGATELQRQISKKEQQVAKLAQEVEVLKKQVPSELVCHGTVSGIQWKTKDTRYDTSIPRDKDVKVAAGDTAVEALAALFRGQLLNDQLVDLLEAFQYDLLSDLEGLGGQDAFEQKVHEKGYRPLTHGICWDLIAEEQTGEEKTPPIPGDIRMLLEMVNIQQRQINLLKRERDAARSQLYAAWYRKVMNAGKPADEKAVDDGLLNQQITSLRNEIGRLSGQIAALENVREGRPAADEWQQLQASLAVFAPGYKLQAVEERRFWRPTDPVVLLAGAACQCSSRHGGDGRYRNDGRLLCRVTGQTVTEMRVAIPGATAQSFGPTELDAWCNPFARRKPASEVVDLFRECLLLTLDLNRALAIAYTIYEKNEPGLAAKSTAEIDRLAHDLLGWLINRVWKDASNPDIKQLDLRYADGQITAELMRSFPSPVMLNRWTNNPWLPLYLQWQVNWTPGYSATSQALENWKLSKRGTAFEWKGGAPGDGQQLYAGTVLLTPSATWTFSERLRQYNLIANSPELKKLQTSVRLMNVLCQSLGGFADNMLMRKACMELRPLEPGNNGMAPQLSSIFDEVSEVDWISPLTDAGFFPIRAGHLKIQQLRVVDAFGQVFDVGQDSLDSIHLPPELTGPKGTIRLEPRFSQPARLRVDWQPAAQGDQEASPVCGWIIPNFLDEGLMIYDAQGYALGALQAVKRESWEKGVGNIQEAIEGFHWVGLPGSSSFFFGQPSERVDDPLGPQVNPQLRAFVKGLLSLSRESGEALGGMLTSISQAVAGAGTGFGQNPNLALLIGKPLALVRASISLELDGGSAHAQGWDVPQKPLAEQSGGIEALAVPLRLGDRRQWHDTWLGEDGLVGFFLNQDYMHFFPAFGLTGSNDSYSTYGASPAASIGKPLDLSLLMDPARGISVTSGILPRQTFQLPYGDLAETLEHKQVIFYTGPVVGPRPQDRDPKIRMPQPSDIYGQWSWTHHPEVEVWRDVAIADTQKDEVYFSETPLAIAEGWLKLVTAPLAVRVFTVKGKNAITQTNGARNGGGKDQQPQEFEVQPGEVILSWTVTGADQIELWQDTSKVFESGRHPLPAQRVVQVNQDTSFTLVAHARSDRLPAPEGAAGNELKKTIKLRVK